MATKAMVSLGDRCLFGLFISMALCEGCSEQSERSGIFSLGRRCGVSSVEDKPLWVQIQWYPTMLVGEQSLQRKNSLRSRRIRRGREGLLHGNNLVVGDAHGLGDDLCGDAEANQVASGFLLGFDLAFGLYCICASTSKCSRYQIVSTTSRKLRYTMYT